MIDVKSLLKPSYIDGLNSVVSDECCGRILYNSINKKVLILTNNEDEATGICYCIKNYVASKMSDKIKVKISVEGVEVGTAYGFIQCMSLEMWQSKQRNDFEGLLFVTNKTLRPMYISEKADFKYLPIKFKEDKKDDY